MLFICFAAYNEQDNIRPLMERIAREVRGEYTVVAYNDGSTDGTLHVLDHMKASHPLVILSSGQNKGLGEGMNQLVAYVAEHGGKDDIAVFMDADDTHDPLVIASMQKAIGEGADVVIASRYQPGGVATGLTWQRQVISKGASLFWQVMLPIKNVKDYSCGFRAYRIGVLREALEAKGGPLISRRGFECQVELLHGLKPFARFAEVPILLAYQRKQGESKMRIWRTTLRTVSLGFCLMGGRGLDTKQP